MSHDSSKKKVILPKPTNEHQKERKTKLYPMHDYSQTKFCSLGSQCFMSQLSSIYYIFYGDKNQKQQQSALRFAKEECSVKSKYYQTDLQCQRELYSHIPTTTP